MPTSNYKLIGFVFDVIAAIVSLLDLATDLIILVTWYQQERMVFFYISLSILILAQLSYVSIFYYNHGTWDRVCYSILSVLCTLPFAPLLSFIFYLVSKNDSIVRKFIDKFLLCFHFDWNENYVDAQASPQQQYLDEKIYKHLGFLLEAMIEAFPQSILQLTAIVYYNEPNTISVLSILISMSSVCSKIFLIVITGNLVTWKMKFFIWLSFVADFFGIFFIVSYAFYTPNNEALHIYFVNIRTICIYEIIICVLPFAVVGSLGLHLYWTMKLSTDAIDTCFYRCILCPLLVIGITFLWVIGLFVTLLSMTIFCVWWAAMGVIGMAISGRLPWDKTGKTFYAGFIHWIMDECTDISDMDNETLISKKEDRKLRICVFNTFILEQHKRHLNPNNNAHTYDDNWMNYFDEKCLNYLQTKKQTRFENVTYEDLRVNCDTSEWKYQHHIWQNKRKHPYFGQTFYYEVYATILTEFKYKLEQSKDTYNYIAVGTLYWLTWIAGPMYILSRCFNVFLTFSFVQNWDSNNISSICFFVFYRHFSDFKLNLTIWSISLRKCTKSDPQMTNP